MARLNEAKVYREVNDGVDEYGLTPLQKLKRKNNKLYIVTNDFFYVAPTAMLVLLEGYLHYVRFSQSY